MSGYETPEPILNSPFDEPQEHWHIVEGETPERRPGRRLAFALSFAAQRPPTCLLRCGRFDLEADTGGPATPKEGTVAWERMGYRMEADQFNEPLIGSRVLVVILFQSQL